MQHPTPATPPPAANPTRRRLHVVVVALCLGLVAPLLVAAPADATPDPTHHGDPIVVSTTAERGDAPLRRVRAVLRCRGRVDGQNPQVVCAWRARTRGAAGFALVRTDRDGRSVVYRSDDLTTRRFTDTDVEFDTRYRYRLVILDDDGAPIGRSRANWALVRSTRPEILPLTCSAAATEPVAVSCAWDAPTGDDATSVQLWRVVPGSPRALITTVDPDVTTAADELPAGVTRARYAVIARDGDGVIVARSRIVRVA